MFSYWKKLIQRDLEVNLNLSEHSNQLLRNTLVGNIKVILSSNDYRMEHRLVYFFIACKSFIDVLGFG